jgi:plastocyanin
MRYVPAVLEVTPGQEITLTNPNPMPHTMTSVLTDDEGQPLFDTPRIRNGESATLVAPTTPGTYEYFCRVHGRMMTGTLVVAE